MNGIPYNSSWIGALGENSIYEYIKGIDHNSSNFTTSTSNILQNNIINTSNILQTQITNTCNLIYKDDDLNTIVRISAQNPYYPISGDPVEMRFTNVNGDYLTKINQTGELFVYHPATPLPVGYSPGWWGVENKIANGITETQGLRFDVTQLQAVTGAGAITDSATATAAVAGAGAGLASAGTATAVAGTAIAGGDIGSAALGVAGASLFAVLGYLSYQAQITSNLTSNGFLTEASQIQNNINSANILLTDNISNICVGKGFITSNIKTPQLIPYLTTNTLKLNNKVITTLALKDIDNFVQTQYGTYYDISNGTIAINATPTQTDFFIVGGQTTIQGELIVENRIKENSLYLSDVYVSSNQIYEIISGTSPERQYPEKIYDNSTTETTTTFLGKTVYTETITLSSGTYGNGNYILYSSETYSVNSTRKYLFNKINVENPTSLFPAWKLNNYSGTTGLYVGITTNNIVSGYNGDWTVIKLLQEIVLTKFIFVGRVALINRAPGLFKIYGSIDGITFTEIVEASNSTTRLTATNYPSNIYTKNLPSSFTTPYLYFGFVVNRLVGNDLLLNFAEWQLYGIDTVNSGTQIKHVYITSNVLQSQNYINSNSITNVLTPYPNYNYLNSYSSNYISSNVLQSQNYINSNSITNVLTPYPNYNYLNSYSSNYISSNILQSQNYINSNSITNILINYSSSNIVKNIVMNMPNVRKHTGFYIVVSTPIGINSITYYKYDLDLRPYTSLGIIQIGPASGDTYRNFNISIYYGSCYYSVLTNNILDVSDYKIFMSYKAVGSSPGVAGLNIASITSSQFYNPNLDKIQPNNLFLMRNGGNDINYITIVSRQPADVRVLISDLIG